MVAQNAASVSAVQARRAESGKYLTFILADESYGLEILKVREIIGSMAITPVPRTPSHVKGVINLRGRVIPVVDLRLKFGLDSVEATDETCIVVVDVQESQTGILVDTVDEVLDIDNEDIEDTPDFGSTVSTDFILGVAKMDEGVKILLNIEEVLASDSFESITELAREMETVIEPAREMETAGTTGDSEIPETTKEES